MGDSGEKDESSKWEILYRILRFRVMITPRRERMITDLEVVRERTMKMREKQVLVLVDQHTQKLLFCHSCRTEENYK